MGPVQSPLVLATAGLSGETAPCQRLSLSLTWGKFGKTECNATGEREGPVERTRQEAVTEGLLRYAGS